jgi:hypothetical protein
VSSSVDVARRDFAVLALALSSPAEKIHRGDLAAKPGER